MTQSTVDNGIKLVAEAAIPGGSLLVDGQIGNGALHTVAGIALGALIGPLGVLLVRANSFSTAVTDNSLLTLFSSGKKTQAPAAAAN